MQRHWKVGGNARITSYNVCYTKLLRDFGAALLPGVDEEYYGLPPSKDYVFEAPAGFRHDSRGFAPLFSFARGGLAQAWTGGCYPLNADELADFPVDPRNNFV